MSYYVHDVPGRIRVKIPSIKADPVMAQEVEGLIMGLPGVTTANANPITGSVVVNYDTDALSSGQILDTLQEKGYFDPSRATTNEQYIQEKISQAHKFIGKALLGVAIEMAFEGSPLALLSAII